MKNKNIIAVTNLIRCLSLDELRNHEVVANLVRAFGIVQWGPAVFGEDELFRNHSVEVAGIYQTPGQISKALVCLSFFKIGSYLEIGVFQGGNFLFASEYLRRFNPEIKCYAVDPTNYLNDEISQIIEDSDWMEFIPSTSDSLFGNKFDLVMIDGDHSAEWVQRDWNNVGQFADFCMFHDIQETSCPDVIEFWGKIKDGKPFVEFLDHSAPVPLQGIGIVQNKKGEVA